MQTGDIIFVRGRTPISRLVRIFDKGEFSHVAIAVSRTHILEARYGARVNIAPFHFGLEDCEIVDLGLTAQQKWELKNNCLKFVGKRYDYAQAIGMALKRGVDNQNAYICTEIIHEMLKGVGWDVGWKICTRDMKPNELYRYLIEKRRRGK